MGSEEMEWYICELGREWEDTSKGRKNNLEKCKLCTPPEAREKKDQKTHRLLCEETLGVWFTGYSKENGEKATGF